MMRRILFVYRILLPPLFLFRLCLPRPPESEQRSSPEDINSLSGELNSETSGRLGDMISTMSSHYKRRNTEIFSDSSSNNMPASNVPRWSTVDTVSSHSLKKINPREIHVHSPKKTTTESDVRNSITASDRNLSTSVDNSVLSFQLLDHLQNGHIEQGRKQRQERTYQNYLPQSQFVSYNLSNFRSRSHHFLRHHETHLSAAKQLFNAPKQRQESRLRRHLGRGRSRRATNNTTSILSRLKLRPPQTTPPEYMVHLFQLLAGTHYEMLRNTVVTSFVNIIDEDVEATRQKNGLGTHTFAFNIFIPQDKEIIEHAELRMYLVFSTQVFNSNSSSSQTNEHSYEISIYEMFSNARDSPDQKLLISSRTVKETPNSWVSFNLTSAVQKWPPSGLKFLEARIHCEKGASSYSVNGSMYLQRFDNDTNASRDDLLDIDMEIGKDPLLVIFSKKMETDEVPQKRERRDAQTWAETLLRLLDDSTLTADHGSNNNAGQVRRNYDPDATGNLSAVSHNLSKYTSSNLNAMDEAPLASNTNQEMAKGENTVFSNFTFLNSKTADNYPKISSQKHELESPAGEQRQLTNAHLRLLQNRKTLSLKDQRHLNGTPDRTSGVHDEFRLSEDMVRMRVRRDTKLRYKRHLDGLFQAQTGRAGRRHKRSKRRNSCRRAEMYVDFQTIKWDKVIIFPPGYQAFECTGKCYTPISEHLSPTKHAIIQTLVHTSYPEKASRACCVPTQLSPISILYWDEHGNIKYEYTYDGMIVEECGCR